MKFEFEKESKIMVSELEIGGTFIYEHNEVWFVSGFCTSHCITALLDSINCKERETIVKMVNENRSDLNYIVCVNLNSGEISNFNRDRLVIPADIICNVRRRT